MLTWHGGELWQAYNALPAAVPIDFGSDNSVTGTGPKAVLLAIYGAAWLMYLLFAALGRVPITSGMWNLPPRVLADRTGRGAQLAHEMLAWINLSMTVLLVLTNRFLLQAAQGQFADGDLVMATLIAGSTLPLLISVYYVVQMYRLPWPPPADEPWHSTPRR